MSKHVRSPGPETPPHGIRLPTAHTPIRPASTRWRRLFGLGDTSIALGGNKGTSAAAASGTASWFGNAAQLGLLLVCATWLVAYLLPGILGHEPWKQDETYTFGIIHHYLRTHEWLVPVNAGQPFMEKPPWFMWTASAFAWLMAPLLPLHDGARLATFFYAALTLGFMAHAAACVPGPNDAASARLSYGARVNRRLRVPVTVALLAGTLLVVKHAHDLFSDVSLLAGTAIAFAALCRIAQACAAEGTDRIDAKAVATTRETPRLPATSRTDGVLFGLGVGIAFLSKGVFIPGIFLLTALAVPLWYPRCRTRRFYHAFGIALLSVAPFVLIWPALLYRASPALFMAWFWDNNVGRFLGFSVAELGSENAPGLIWKAMLGAGFPVGPLALCGLLFGGWGRLRDADAPAIGIATCFGGLGMVTLAQSATVRQLYLLPFTIPAALLATDALHRLAAYGLRSRRATPAARWAATLATVVWDWASRLLFAAFALLVWVVWAARSWGSAQGWIGGISHNADASSLLECLTRLSIHSTAWLGRWLPLDFPMPFQPGAVLAALALTGGWCVLMPHLRRMGVGRGAMSWCAGVTLAWGLVNTLLLPWIDRAKSYGPVYQSLAAQWAEDWHAGDCVAGVHLGESEAPMLQYFTGRTARPIDGAAALASSGCRWVIVQRPGQLPTFTDDATHPSAAQWTLYWDGARQGDTQERLTVYRSRTAGGTPHMPQRRVKAASAPYPAPRQTPDPAR